jgi:hypothetical protein
MDSEPTWMMRPDGSSFRSMRPKNSTISSYDPAFAQALKDAYIYSEHHIYPNRFIGPTPENLDEIQCRLVRHRDSISSPNAFTNDHFQNFVVANNKAETEMDIISDVLTTIRRSKDDPTFAYGQNFPFNHLQPLAPSIADAKPDYFTGANVDQIQQRVRAELGQYIIPSNKNSRPAAPNFFTEVKGQDGSLEKCNRQLTQDLGTGARAMHKLQHYRQDESVYDGKAYTFGATFTSTNALLSLYTMHPSTPIDGNAEPQYHTTCVAYYRLTINAKTYREGIAAWRNLRDLAREKRDELIS